MAMDNSGMADERGGQGSATKTTLIYLAVGFGLLIVGWAVQPRFQAAGDGRDAGGALLQA